MKSIIRNLSLLAFLGLMSVQLNAQVDRSAPPKPGPEPKISLEKPQEFELKNGIKVLLVQNEKLPRVSYTLSIDNRPLLEGEKAGELSLLSAMLGNGTTSIAKDDFNEEVDFMGANISFSSGGAFASGLSKYSDRIIELMADAAINPLLTEEEFEKEKDKLLENLKTEEKSVDAISSRVSSALSYGKNHVYGEFVTPETVNNVAFQDVLNTYKIRFAPERAYIVIVGDIDLKTAKKQVKKYFKDWKPSGMEPQPVPALTPNVKTSEIDFIDMPNAVQSYVSATNNVNLKMSDSDYHAALITNNILGGGGEGYLFKNLREDKGYTYGSYSSLGANRYGVARFNASASVRNMVTDSAVVEILHEIKRIRTEPVDPQTLQDAKSKYVGNFVMALERPQTIANYALNIKRNNLPDDFYANYLENINKVSVEDVQRVAQKYISLDQTRVIVVGKGSEVITNLEKIGLPINYFDTEANPTQKPEFTKPLPADATALKVMQDYISAIGGQENVDKIQSVLTQATVSIQGVPMEVSAVTKQMLPNKYFMEMSIAGMGSISTQVFDGESGYQMAQGQKIEFTDDQIAKMKMSALFQEQHFTAEQLSLESINPIEGQDAYKVKVMMGGNESIRYYSVKSGLLIRTEETQEAQGMSITTVTDLSDYREVNGVLMPFSMKINAGQQKIQMSVSDILVNQDVSDADFK